MSTSNINRDGRHRSGWSRSIWNSPEADRDRDELAPILHSIAMVFLSCWVSKRLSGSIDSTSSAKFDVRCSILDGRSQKHAQLAHKSEVFTAASSAAETINPEHYNGEHCVLGYGRYESVKEQVIFPCSYMKPSQPCGFNADGTDRSMWRR